MKLKPEDERALAVAIAQIVERRERQSQRLLPLHEAQAVQDDLNQIKVHVEDVFNAAERIGLVLPYALRHELDGIRQLCNGRILEMHSHFHNGRKRKRVAAETTVNGSPSD